MTFVHDAITYVAAISLDAGKVGLGQFNSFLMLGEKLLGGMLREAALNHLLYLECLNPQKVQYHVVGEPELRSQLGRFAQDHGPQLAGRRRLISAWWYNYDRTNTVQPSPTSPTRHLGVFTGKQVAEGMAIMLSIPRKDDSACGKIEAHGKSFRRK